MAFGFLTFATPLVVDADAPTLDVDFTKPGYARFPATLVVDLVGRDSNQTWLGSWDGAKGGYSAIDYAQPTAVPDALAFGTDFTVLPTAQFVNLSTLPPDVLVNLTLGTDWTYTPSQIFAEEGIE